MKKIRTIKIYQFVILIIIASLVACFDPQEGCLEINASNFDPTADENCCCIFPDFKVQIAQRYGEDIFNLDSFYFNNLNQAFAIKNVQFYLSGFELIDENNNALLANEKLEVYWNNNGTIQVDSIKDDILLVNRSFVEEIIGTVDMPNDFQAVELYFGLTDTASCVIADSIASTHPMGPKIDSLFIYPDGKYNFAIIEIEDLNGQVYNLELQSNAPRLISLDYFYSVANGDNAAIPLIVDYREWLADVNFNTMTIQQIADKIVINISSSFKIFE